MIFRQKRYGLDGKEIVVYKFRSMTVTEDGNKSYTQVTAQRTRASRRLGHSFAPRRWMNCRSCSMSWKEP